MTTADDQTQTQWHEAALRLRAGVQALGLALSPATEGKILDYLQTMRRWNRVFNLTAISDPDEMVARHVLDSLAILPHLPPGALLDVGSGAGLPGIPLALFEPTRAITLLDRSHKRADFLTEVAGRLALSHVNIVCERVEDHRPAAPYDVVAARAFASLGDIAAAVGHLLAPEGRIVAMKGTLPTEELAAVAAPFIVTDIHGLAIPGLAAQRHLVVLARAP